MTLAQKILTGFIACTVILIAVAFFSFRNSRQFIEANDLVAHTHEVMYSFDLVLAGTLDAESSVRGFVITGNDEHLDNYRLAKTKVFEHLEKVQRLTSDNQVQQDRIDRLHEYVSQRHRSLDELVNLRRRDFEEARKLVSAGGGKLLQDQIRQTVTAARNMEGDLLGKRKDLTDTDSRNFTLLFVSLLIVIGLVLLGVYLVIMSNLRAMKQLEKEREDRNWLLAGNLALNERIRGERSAEQLSQAIIEQICTYTGAQIGILYLFDHGVLHRAGSFAFDAAGKETIQLGEGLAGQAAIEQRLIVFKDVPADYLRINSGMGGSVPRNIICFPLVMNDELKGVAEIGATEEFSDLHLQLLNRIGENAAIAIAAAQSRSKLQELLEEAQRLSEELEVQQEELKQYNEELQEKTGQLERSEAELKTQQEELQQVNEELEEKANLLEGQKTALENAQVDLQSKARELQVTSRYKTEFLANMSHELRTPLNSIIILSQILAENRDNRLSEKEVEFAQTIYNSGNDQLNLINEILDLAKIEAGKVDLDIETIKLNGIISDLKSMFSELAKTKMISFDIRNDLKDIEALTTDGQRLQQILRNLLSNAFKFTKKDGTVELSIYKAPMGVPFKNPELLHRPDVIAFAVKDTGIGIPAEKLDAVFEAFQQADGGTKRKYGGTGLGLSISRELAHALGGEIIVSSREGEGSQFTLYLPQHFSGSLTQVMERKVEVRNKTAFTVADRQLPDNVPGTNGEFNDDRHHLHENDKIILILEDDPAFANLLLDFVRERNYKGIVATQGNTGLSYARYYKPDAILLDMKLPVMDGAEVLKYLKNDPSLRHIPVQIISGHDMRKRGLELGAFDFINKPVQKNDLQKAFNKIEDFINRKLKKLLVVEDNAEQNKAIRELIGNGDVKSLSAYSGAEAFEMLNQDHFDCIIVDLGLPDMSGFDLLEKIKDNNNLNRVPVIVYTGKDLSREENNQLMRYANTVVLKTADSHERLLDETMLFLHRVESRLPKEKQNIIRKLHKSDEVLVGRKALVVDDDIRNIYSLTNVLEDEGMVCLVADNGQKAVEMITENPDVDIVLMDVMMPEMDGYEATRHIRSMVPFNKLPIIALTAKAIRGDREKCLAAGMSDYVSKPVDIEKLLSLMRVWLYK